MRLGPSCSLLALVTLALVPRSAGAEPLAPALVRLLHTPGLAHPLADASGRVPVTVALPVGADAASLGLLEVAPGVGAVHLPPAGIAAFAAAHPELVLSVAPPRRALLDRSGKWTHATSFRAVTGLAGKGVLVGIVDTGLDLAHPDFRDAKGKTRVAWLLAGGVPPAGLHPELEQKFGCADPKQSACAVYAAADIDQMIADGTVGVHDAEGHGTHVTSIAAGNGGPMITKHPRYVGVAPEATLIIAAPTQKTGFFDADILNAARFVFDRADALALPLVVNLSIGGDYGAHDGTSTLEKGLSALVGDDKPGRVIVVAAGNSGALTSAGAADGPHGQHTEVHVSPDEVTRVPILADAADSAQGFVWITFRPGDAVEVAFDGPGQQRWVGFTGPGAQAGYAGGAGTDAIKAGVVNDLPSANSALTADTNSAVVVFTGHWPASSDFGVLLRGSGDASLWITGTGGAAQKLLFTRALRQGTVNVPASAPGLLAVGCTINRLSWTPLGGPPIQLGAVGDDPSPLLDGACFFSASGPTPFGVQKPEISAPGGYVAAAMSADADPRNNPGGLFDIGGCPAGDAFCAVVDDRHAVAQGTSMSAPHVTGAVALLMGIDPTLTQARATEVLQAGARRPTGHVPDPDQLGPGELDLEGARQALLDPPAVPADADPGQSWYTLSSAYARPDPSWPVWGTLELRKLDGALAGGVDGSKLALTVTGGALYQPLTRVRPGLWRFAVAGRAGDGGGTLAIDVTYAGISLGARTLPIGLDAWSAQDRSIGAAGGACTCELAGRGGAGGGGAGGGGAAGLAAMAGLAMTAAVGRRAARGRRRRAATR